MKICNACGLPKAHIEMGGASLCDECLPIVQGELPGMKQKNHRHAAKAVFKKRVKSRTYILRDIPYELLQKAQHFGVKEGMPVRDVILISLYHYLGT